MGTLDGIPPLEHRGTMKFRRLYWVTEQVATDGSSHVTGVYTSVPDLADHGLRYMANLGSGFRLSLVQLDSTNLPLGTWTAPAFEGIEDALKPYTVGDEITDEHRESLLEALRTFSAAASRP